MRHRLACLLFALSTPSWAGITIACGDADRSFVFQEGIDDYYLDAVERSNYGTFIGEARHGGAGDKFTARFRIPKKPARGEEPACRFSSASPLIFQCSGPEFMGSIDLVSVQPAPRESVIASYLSIEAREVRSEAWDPEKGQMVRQSVLRIRYTTDAQVEAKQDLPIKPYRVDADYPLVSCKTGEGIDTPAH
jgi:hypothetical protein